MTYLKAKVKFGNLGFSIGKSETVDFSEIIATSDLKGVMTKHLIEVSIEVLGHSLTLAQGRVHRKIQTGFAQKLMCRSEPNFA